MKKKKKKIFLKFNLNTNWLSALFPEFFFFAIGVVGANIWSIDFEGNKAENLKADKVT